MPLAVGDDAPDFEVPDETGNLRTLKEFRGRWWVLYFYPKDETPGCVAEACAFRDDFEAFRELDVPVVGVSADTVESHLAFKQSRNLPFTLLADPERRMIRAYDVAGFLGLPKRVTYVIDPEGRVAHVHESRLRPAGHVGGVLEFLRSHVPA